MGKGEREGEQSSRRRPWALLRAHLARADALHERHGGRVAEAAEPDAGEAETCALTLRQQQVATGRKLRAACASEQSKGTLRSAKHSLLAYRMCRLNQVDLDVTAPEQKARYSRGGNKLDETDQKSRLYSPARQLPVTAATLT
eukprot:6204147-Pleurochrysis_carterae.AAC.1